MWLIQEKILLTIVILFLQSGSKSLFIRSNKNHVNHVTRQGSRKVECNEPIADPTQGRASKMFMVYKSSSAVCLCVKDSRQILLSALDGNIYTASGFPTNLLCSFDDVYLSMNIFFFVLFLFVVNSYKYLNGGKRKQ